VVRFIPIQNENIVFFFIGNPTVMASASNATPGDYFRDNIIWALKQIKAGIN
jgi:hypothetical protein